MTNDNTILYFGSFNPIHYGHIRIIEYLLENHFGAEIWLVISPLNPLKKQTELLGEQHRATMVRLALEDEQIADKVKVCDIEFNMPKPSYTANTIRKLKECYPERRFSLLIGEDNLAVFHLWKEYDYLLDTVPILTYPRIGTIRENGLDKHPGVTFLKNAPLFKISSTEIRSLLKKENDITPYVPLPVIDYIKRNELYV